MQDATQARPPLDAAAQIAPALCASRLTKRYGDLAAVEDLTFTVPRGAITGLLGPNGAGKTTTLRLLLGLATPSAGGATVLGQPYHQLEHPSRRVGAVLESGDFDRGRTGRNHLRALALAAGIERDRVADVLALVELTAAADRTVWTYSLGMRQRLGLAGALLGDPELLILDEPANGLDPAGVHWLRRFLRAFAQGGRSVLLCSHVLAEVAQTVDSVLILNHGRLVAERRIADLLDPGALEDFYLRATAGPTP
jgi:ABC-2 type transport system ATP-binding protein